MEENSLAEESRLGPIAVNHFGENFFFKINRNSFDKVSAQVLYESKFGDSLFNEDSLNIIVGTDCGLLPRYIQNKRLPKGSRYIFIEPEAVLQTLKSNLMIDDLDEDRIVCISMEDWAETIQNFKIKDYFYIDAVHSFNAICAEDDYIQEYAELSWHITEVLSQLNWINTIELGSEAFITRQIINLADNIRPAKLLEKAFRNKTVVLLAGGPSLDQALPWLEKNRHKFIVFAVSRIARQLLQASIEPDFVFSVDPTELSFDISKEMLNFGSKTTFVCSHHAVSNLVNQWLGHILYLGARLPWKSALNESNIGSAGPTVTNTALNVAHEFGFARIILIGVDLCFTKEGYTHAKGSNEFLAGPRFNLTSLQVETNDGFMAPSSCDFVQAILNLGIQAKRLTAKGCRIINVSGNAAKVEGIEYLPLEEIELEDELPDVAGIVEAKIADLDNKAHFYRKTREELKRAQFQVSAIAKLSANASRINTEMYSSQGVIENYKDKRKLDQIEKKLKHEHREYSKLVKKFGIRKFIKLTKPFSDEDWTAEEAKLLGNVYYEAYQEGAAKLLRLINDAIERVTARLSENTDTPDYKLLIETCRKDRSFGRVRLWRKKFSDLKIPDEIIETFDEFENSFVEILNEKNTRHFSRTKANSSLIILKQRAGLLYKHKKIDDLHDLQAGLAKHDLDTESIPYSHLINGYLAELKNNADEALESYRQIVDAGDVLLEEALIRIASISIGQNDMSTANISLQCLSQLNPLYLPLFAEMRRLDGDILTAIDAYSSYINQFPEDTLTQIKLAMLYAEQKIYDAAELMLDYILQKKPNFETAIAFKKQLFALKADNQLAAG